MKKLMFAVALLSSMTSFACIETGKGNKICTGNTVIVGQGSSADWGIVATVNLKTNKIGVQDKFGWINVHNIDEVQAEKGCLEEICVGDRATADNLGYQANVVAVNSKTRMIGLIDRSYGYAYSFPIDEVQVIKKCPEYGDEARSSHFKSSQTMH